MICQECGRPGQRRFLCTICGRGVFIPKPILPTNPPRKDQP